MDLEPQVTARKGSVSNDVFGEVGEGGPNYHDVRTTCSAISFP